MSTPERMTDLERLVVLILDAGLDPLESTHITTPQYEHFANLTERICEGGIGGRGRCLAMMPKAWSDAIAAVYNAAHELICELRAERERADEQGRMRNEVLSLLSTEIAERDSLRQQLDQVDDVLIVNWVGPREDGDYRQALADLVRNSIQEHDDPAISEVADKRRKELDSLRQQLATAQADYQTVLKYGASCEEKLETAEEDTAKRIACRIREVFASMSNPLYGVVADWIESDDWRQK